jgi:hypothetical protein
MSKIPKDREPPIDELARRYRDGQSARELARAYGLDRELIRRRLIAAGVRMRGPGAHGANEEPTVPASLIEAAATVREILERRRGGRGEPKANSK